MIHDHIIKEIIRRLIDHYRPQTIYLFGSYAWGNPDEDSDLDFLIVVDTLENRYKELVAGYILLSDIGAPKDLMVLTTDEFALHSQNQSQFMYKIKHEGKRLYARSYLMSNPLSR